MQFCVDKKLVIIWKFVVQFFAGQLILLLAIKYLPPVSVPTAKLIGQYASVQLVAT